MARHVPLNPSRSGEGNHKALPKEQNAAGHPEMHHCGSDFGLFLRRVKVTCPFEADRRRQPASRNLHGFEFSYEQRVLEM